MKFSICIPNYNYGRYIGKTIRSALDQHVEVEVLVSDNASTDDSVAVVESIGDARVHLRRNAWNVGFAGNLDRACEGATGDRMILLSSDDLAGPHALTVYENLAREIGVAEEHSVFLSSAYVIDHSGLIIGVRGFDPVLWSDARKDASLSSSLGMNVFRVDAKSLLKRSFAHMRNPLHFVSTCYPKSLYHLVEGYGAGALMNPDKAFAWKLLSVAENVYFIDEPLFSYRVHDANQTSLQQQSGALKHLLDQYRSAFDTAPEVLKAAGVTREDLAKAFIEHDVALRGLKAVAEGERHLARRHLDFGRAAYPALISRSRRAWMLRIALALGPLGTAIARHRLEAALAVYRTGGVIDASPKAPMHG